jgi:hypothetical protein
MHYQISMKLPRSESNGIYNFNFKVMELTEEQANLIANYWLKWQSLAISTKPIDRVKIDRSIKLLYKAANLNEPEIVFVASPDRYYAQAFFSSMSDSIQALLEPILRSNPHNIFLDQPQQNITIALSHQLLLPIERLKFRYLQELLRKSRDGNNITEANGKNITEANREEDLEVYLSERKLIFRTISQVDRLFANKFGTSNHDFLHVKKTNSWLGAIYDRLNANISIPRELICKMADLGYNYEFSGIEVGCIDRVLLAFAGARLDYFKNILGFQGIFSVEVVESFVCAGSSMFFPYQKICIVCDVPNILTFDNFDKEAEFDLSKAIHIQFSDGFNA